MTEINVFRYIAYNKPQAVYDILQKAGYTDIKRDKEYIASLLAHYVNREKDAALKEMMSVHPDKETLLELCSKPATGIHEETGFLNSQGCENCKFKNADAEQGQKSFQISERTINLLIIGGSTVLGASLLALIITNALKK